MHRSAPLALALLLALAAAPAGAPASGQDMKKPMDGMHAGRIVVEQPWSRATAGRAPNGAAFMTLANQGDAVDRLVAAATPVAERAEMHTHLMDGGVMRMRPVEGIEVAPGSPTVLQPGGLHIMLFGLKERLAEGATFPLTLSFANAGEVTVEVTVRKASATVPTGAGGHGHGHGGHGS
jgi:copper(I)-binding protein